MTTASADGEGAALVKARCSRDVGVARSET